MKVTSPAPQGQESDVTYVKILPVVEDAPLAASAGARESRIEKLPLTIPGILTSDKEPDKLLLQKSENQHQSSLENKSGKSEIKTDLSESKSDLSEKESDPSENLDLSETVQSDTFSDLTGTEEISTTDDLSDISPTDGDDLSVSHTDNFSDIVPSETISQSDRRARNFDSVETTEAGEDATSKYEDELINHTEIEPPRTRAPPEFVSKAPKLSYYPETRAFQSYSANHLDVVGKRKFRSKCSCQKIWNCPKLQISVPRCPNEYFLCCF